MFCLSVAQGQFWISSSLSNSEDIVSLQMMIVRSWQQKYFGTSHVLAIGDCMELWKLEVFLDSSAVVQNLARPIHEKDRSSMRSSVCRIRGSVDESNTLLVMNGQTIAQSHAFTSCGDEGVGLGDAFLVPVLLTSLTRRVEDPWFFKPDGTFLDD